MKPWADMSAAEKEAAKKAEDAARRVVFSKIRAAIGNDVRAAGGDLEATMDNLAGWKDVQFPERWNVGVWGDLSASVLEALWPSMWAEDNALLIRRHRMPRTDADSYSIPGAPA